MGGLQEKARFSGFSKRYRSAKNFEKLFPRVREGKAGGKRREPPSEKRGHSRRAGFKPGFQAIDNKQGRIQSVSRKMIGSESVDRGNRRGKRSSGLPKVRQRGETSHSPRLLGWVSLVAGGGKKWTAGGFPAEIKAAVEQEIW